MLLPLGGKILNWILAISQKPVERNNSRGELLFCRTLVTTNVAPIRKIFTPLSSGVSKLFELSVLLI